MNNIFKAFVVVLLALASAAQAQYIPVTTGMSERQMSPPPFTTVEDMGPLDGSSMLPSQDQAEKFAAAEFQGSFRTASHKNSCRVSWVDFKFNSLTARDAALEKVVLCRNAREEDTMAFGRVSIGLLFEKFILENKQKYYEFEERFNVKSDGLIGSERLKAFVELLTTKDPNMIGLRKDFFEKNQSFSDALEAFYEKTKEDKVDEKLAEISQRYQADVAHIEAAYAKYLKGE